MAPECNLPKLEFHSKLHQQFSTPMKGGWNCVEVDGAASMQEQWCHICRCRNANANYINIGWIFPIWKWNVNVWRQLLPAVTWKLRIKSPNEIISSICPLPRYTRWWCWWWRREPWQITHRRFVSRNIFKWMNKVNVVHEPHDDEKIMKKKKPKTKIERKRLVGEHYEWVLNERSTRR